MGRAARGVGAGLTCRLRMGGRLRGPGGGWRPNGARGARGGAFGGWVVGGWVGCRYRCDASSSRGCVACLAVCSRFA